MTASSIRLGILSDIHYASAAEQARGRDYELRGIANPALRLFVRVYRRFFWLYRPLERNCLLDDFLAEIGSCNHVVSIGDYSCNSAAVGVSDDAAFDSVSQCLDLLRSRFGANFHPAYGDHELGKVSLFGGRGGMRFASWKRARRELNLEPFWQVMLGNYVLFGVVSSLVALPVFEADTLPEERPLWTQARDEHLRQITAAFKELRPDQKVLLFCHDPTALPFLAREPLVQARFGQIETTFIGHLHSPLILWKSRLLAGMPRLNFMGHTARRLSSALREGRLWRPFNVVLCPSLAGIQLLKDGGYLTAELDPAAREPMRLRRHRLPRQR